MKKYINKVACFTDIHFGKGSANSDQHNKDCLEFIEFFCEHVKKYKAEAVIFLGDWHESRNSINCLTLDYSYRGAKMLNDLEIPIKIISGNHDQFFRLHRDVTSINFMNAFENIEVVNDPKEFPEFGSKGSLLCPWLQHEDYPLLLNYNHLPIFFLHAEFKGYVATGDTIKLEHGPDASDYTKPKRIFSGHLHKKQNYKGTNVFFMGNVFPTNFGDANDDDRGMMLYDFDKDETTYINWPDAPTFVKTSLTELMNDPSILKPKATVKCLADTDITLEESSTLKEQFMKTYSLRDFQFEEPTTEALKNTDMDLTGLELESTNKIVVNLLGRINEPKINSGTLIKIWKDL